MREFILYSRLGRTDSKWVNLHDAGRLDIVYECIVSAFFLSHGLRRDVRFHAVLNGPPCPPVRIVLDGSTLHDVRTDQQTWTAILRKALSGKPHPGVAVDRLSFEALVKSRAGQRRIYVLEEDGRDVGEVLLGEDAIFVLGDHIGLPRTVEKFVLRYGEKISLGKIPYLAAHCITILNYRMDGVARNSAV
ncbi:MAG: tRNA (pseudouridine(54)-N(1))-methyltransferase TrmY [Candidatus Bathyarchaeia archaeon]